MAQKPNTPKGTRDFATLELAKRNYIIDNIKTQFRHFGFQAIETPAFENNDTLLGKYGDEGDRLIFKILNSGDFLAKVPQDILETKDSAKAAAYLTEKALRYDLTVPFARFVVQHQNDLVFPFKRYQIQPVWRADRPQKGRFREFYQCDADVVGSKSLWQEVEFILLYDRVFHNLQLTDVTIKINHRKILTGLAVLMDASDKLIDFTVALDKLDKIGKEAVIQELLDRGISQQAIDKLNPVFDISGNFSEKLTQLETLFQGNESGLEGIQELRFIEAQVAAQGLDAASLRLDLTLARGLNYYTGAILEVAAPASVGIGSIGGGGRYDDLTGVFGLKNISGVGVSFGLDRIYIALETLGLFPETISGSTQVLFINFSHPDAAYAFDAVQKLRKKGVIAELYPDAIKPQKQLAFADKRHIPVVVFAGEAERQAQVFTLKNMKTGEQQSVNFDELAASFVVQGIK